MVSPILYRGSTELARVMADFRDEGMAVLTSVIDTALAETLASRAVEAADHSGILRDGESSQGGQSLSEILDGYVVTRDFPELVGIYNTCRWVAANIVGEMVIVSPFARSAINVKVYRKPEAGQGWHYDSNPLSGLLYLTSGGQPTEFKTADGRLIHIVPEAGALAIFRGRDILHRVPQGAELRVTCPLNYYYPGD